MKYLGIKIVPHEPLSNAKQYKPMPETDAPDLLISLNHRTGEWAFQETSPVSGLKETELREKALNMAIASRPGRADSSVLESAREFYKFLKEN